MSNEMYKLFYKRLHETGNQIELSKVAKTPRKGFGRIVDKIVFYKSAFQNGQSWAALPSSLLNWTALTPIALANINEIFKFIGLPIAIPLSWGSMVAVGVIAGLVIFGVVSWTRSGLIRRGSELGAMQDSGRYLTFCELQETKRLIHELTVKVNALTEKQ